MDTSGTLLRSSSNENMAAVSILVSRVAVFASLHPILELILATRLTLLKETSIT